jgi:hypothetical protein
MTGCGTNRASFYPTGIGFGRAIFASARNWLRSRSFGRRPEVRFPPPSILRPPSSLETGFVRQTRPGCQVPIRFHFLTQLPIPKPIKQIQPSRARWVRLRVSAPWRIHRRELQPLAAAGNQLARKGPPAAPLQTALWQIVLSTVVPPHAFGG